MKTRGRKGGKRKPLACIHPIDSANLGAKGTPAANVVDGSGVTSKRGGTSRISLLGPFWKCPDIIVYISKIEFRNCVLGFPGSRGAGMATTEVKLTQQLDYMDQVLLYGGFVDLKKT